MMAVKVPVEESEQKNMDTLKKWIIRLLGVGDGYVKGKTKIVKAFFLLVNDPSIREKYPELRKISDFFPHQFGPYSARFGEAMNELMQEKIVVPEKVNGDWKFVLSDEGKKVFAEELKTLSQEEKELLEKIQKKVNKTPLARLLREIYEEYPEYAVYSKIREDLLYGY